MNEKSPDRRAPPTLRSTAVGEPKSDTMSQEGRSHGAGATAENHMNRVEADTRALDSRHKARISERVTVGQ
jgi:hypothetical protein